MRTLVAKYFTCVPLHSYMLVDWFLQLANPSNNHIVLGPWSWKCPQYVLRYRAFGSYVVWIHVYIRKWTACSKYDNHSRLKSQHNYGNLYNPFLSTRIFTHIRNKIWVPTIMRKVATTLTWIYQLSHSKCVFYSLGEVG